MPYGTGRSGDNVRVYYGDWAGVAQHVNIATPKDAVATSTRTGITAADIPDAGPFDPTTLAPFDLLDGNYLVFTGSSTQANTSLSFLLVCYTADATPFMSESLSLSVGGFYKVGPLYIPTGGGAMAGPFIGVESVAVCVTNVTGGTWTLEAKVCF